MILNKNFLRKVIKETLDNQPLADKDYFSLKEIFASLAETINFKNYGMSKREYLHKVDLCIRSYITAKYYYNEPYTEQKNLLEKYFRQSLNMLKSSLENNFLNVLETSSEA